MNSINNDILKLQSELESDLKNKLENIANIYTDPEYVDLQINNEKIRVPSIIFNPDKKVDFWAITSFEIGSTKFNRVQISDYDINEPVFSKKKSTYYNLSPSEQILTDQPIDDQPVAVQPVVNISNQSQQYLINSIINSYIKPTYEEDWSESYNDHFNAYGYK